MNATQKSGFCGKILHILCNTEVASTRSKQHRAFCPTNGLNVTAGKLVHCHGSSKCPCRIGLQTDGPWLATALNQVFPVLYCPCLFRVGATPITPSVVWLATESSLLELGGRWCQLPVAEPPAVLSVPTSPGGVPLSLLVGRLTSGSQRIVAMNPFTHLHKLQGVPGVQQTKYLCSSSVAEHTDI